MSVSDLNTFGAYEAKTRWSHLLKRVAAGEEITITHHGHPIARLIPALPETSPTVRQEAILRMRELANRNRLDGLTIRELMIEGRK